ncbi:hypothetical protein BJ742DRAFT_772141 [Cladochytrium replicatum]|nr:hypothetical protein BJ742DRAFT_772141 [Cladochytrium replicatum]
MFAEPKAALIAPHARFDSFAEAVQIVFKHWTALQLAVDHQTAGPDTDIVASNLVRDVIAFFQSEGSTVAMDELAWNLEDCFANDLHVDLEDRSFEQVARRCVELYGEIVGRGETKSLEALRQAAQSSPSATQMSKGEVHEEEVDDDDDEMGMEVDAPVAGPSSSAPAPPKDIDEDGFELVQKKGKRR